MIKASVGGPLAHGGSLGLISHKSRCLNSERSAENLLKTIRISVTQNREGNYAIDIIEINYYNILFDKKNIGCPFLSLFGAMCQIQGYTLHLAALVYLSLRFHRRTLHYRAVD